MCYFYCVTHVKRYFVKAEGVRKRAEGADWKLHLHNFFTKYSGGLRGKM